MSNGWKNHQTWNVAMHLGNNEAWYYAMMNWAEHNPRGRYEDMVRTLQSEHILGAVTPDGVSWTDPTLDHDELDAMLAEFATDLEEA